MPMGGHAAPPVRRAPSPPPPPPALSTFILALVTFIFSHAAVSSVADSAENLLKFKTALINVDALKSWQPLTDPCTNHWFGILCMDGQVWALQLENLQLSGQIDVDSLVPLPMLRSLSFINNNFQGPMPDWKKLVALKSLFISGNHFSGEIPPDTFEGMSYLKKVHMGNNEFTGPIPSSLSTPRLLELTVENNQFTGPIPDLRDGIKAFNASNNQLEGPIPPSLEKLDPSSFSGNEGLCGKPLGADCNSEPDDDDIPKTPNSDSNTPPPPQPPPPYAAPKSKAPIIKIVILVIAILVSLALIILILLAYLRSRRKKTDSIIETTAYNQSNPSIPSSSYEVEAPPAVVVGGTVARKPDSGKLTFVRDDRERFDLQDLLRASAEVLGSGNFGSSYRAILMDGKAVVVKRFKQMSNVDREDFHEHMRRLGRLHHHNLLPLVAYYYRKEEKLLVFDHLKNGSLAGSLHGHGKHSGNKPHLDWPKRLKIIEGVSKGLLYLQTKLPSVTVAHGNLKSTNVLLDDELNPLLTDYALHPVVNIEQEHQLLVSYKSPEYSQTGRLSKKTDVWCLGILILETLTGKIPPNYVIGQGAVPDSVLAGWVNSIISDENALVFDPEMRGTENSIGEIEKLLTIGAACCEEDVEKRWDLSLVVERLEDVKEKEN